MRTTLATFVIVVILPFTAFAEVVKARYSTASEVPVSAAGFTAHGKTVDLTLNFAPLKGVDLVLVHNTSSGFIAGTFDNLGQGQIVSLPFGGLAYHFVANYYGGSGRDLVLMSINVDDLSAAVLQKMDSQLVLALKKSRGQAPFDRATSLRPEDCEKGERVLVDINNSVSNQLADQIAQLGGEVSQGWQTPTTLRAWVPFKQLEAVANLDAIQSMSAAVPSVTRRLVHH